MARDDTVQKIETAQDVRIREESSFIGGMRQPHLSNQLIPGSNMTGVRLRVELMRQLALRVRIKEFTDHSLDGRTKETSYPAELDEARSDVLKLLGGTWGPSSCSPVRPDLVLQAYVAQSGDPEQDVPNWIRGGAPFGAINPINCNQVFPAVSRDEIVKAPVYDHTPPGWSNYKSVEDAPDIALQILDSKVKKGWAQRYATVEQMAKAVNLSTAQVPLNKLGLITKQRADGSLKHRLIWDLRRSQVNEELHQGQRILLPRFRDMVGDVLEIAQYNSGQQILFTVADFSDAFHLIPVNEQEIKYQTVIFGNKLYAFKVLVFGSAVAPTLWGRLAALLARSAQALVPAQTTRIELYVDDPIIISGGCPP